MPNNNDDSLVPGTRRSAGSTDGFDQGTEGDDDQQKRADAALDDLEIEVDENEMKAESQNQPPGRKD